LVALPLFELFSFPAKRREIEMVGYMKRGGDRENRDREFKKSTEE